jgi:AcrR family transcriptional regulator
MTNSHTVGDRRANRRTQTIAEILGIAVAVMGESGAAGLSLSEVARRLGVQPPSLYKYFPSRLALYDRLFLEGQTAHLARFRAGAASAEPGLPALLAALDAGGRWCMANRELAELMFWRPVPGFTPSAEAFAPAQEMVADVRRMLTEAVAAGTLAHAAATDEGVTLASIVATGVMSQQLANAPGEPYDEGRFTSLAPQAWAMFTRFYAPVEVPDDDIPARP